MRSQSLLFTALIAPAVACSATRSEPDVSPSWGGASFALWPPPSDGTGDPSENPWLTGEALAPQPEGAGGASAAGGGQSAPGGHTGGTGGGPAVPPPSASSGGAGDIPPPIASEPARLRLRAYVESAGSFKGLLVEHVAGDPSGSCGVELYSNGNTEVWRSLELPAGLTTGERALLCIPDGATPACTVGFGGSVYNGNDALVLRCDGVVLDTIGTVGVDPGKGWSGIGFDGQPVSTVDSSLWRCSEAEASVGFDPAEWMTWDWSTDPTFAGPTCPEEPGGAAGSSGE